MSQDVSLLLEDLMLSRKIGGHIITRMKDGKDLGSYGVAWYSTEKKYGCFISISHNLMLLKSFPKIKNELRKNGIDIKISIRSSYVVVKFFADLQFESCLLLTDEIHKLLIKAGESD